MKGLRLEALEKQCVNKERKRSLKLQYGEGNQHPMTKIFDYDISMGKI